MRTYTKKQIFKKRTYKYIGKKEILKRINSEHGNFATIKEQ